MNKLTLTRLEDRIVYDAAPLPVPEPAEAPAMEAAEADAPDAPHPDGDDGEKSPVAVDGDAPVSPAPGASAWFALDSEEAGFLDCRPPSDLADQGAAALVSPIENEVEDSGASSVGNDDVRMFRFLLDPAANLVEGEVERPDGAAPEGWYAGIADSDADDTLDIWDGAGIFDRYQVAGDMNNWMCMFVDLIREKYGDGEYAKDRIPLHEYLIGGRLGADPMGAGFEMRLYWTLDSGEKAYLVDSKIVDITRLQLLIQRNIDGDAIFLATLESNPAERVSIPFMDVLNELRFYSSPDDIASDGTQYFLNVSTTIDGSEVVGENRVLNQVDNPSEEVPVPEPGDVEIHEPTGPGPGEDFGEDDGTPGVNPGPDDGTPGEPDDPGLDDDLSEFDSDLMRGASIRDLIRIEELPENIRGEIEELSDLIGEIEESDVPAARDIAANIVELGRSHALFSRGVSRLIGMLAAVEGLDKTPALAEWVGDTVKRGERLLGESAGHVARLLRAVREFRATDAAMRDSMAYAQIAGIGAAMDAVNQKIRVIAAGFDMLSDNIVAMRGFGAAAEVLAILPLVEEHMAAVAKDMQKLDMMRDTMFYVLRNARALNGAPEG